jgi:Cu/Zn superoxide dismutase
MKKSKLIVIAFTLVAMFTFSSITSEASTSKVMWGKTELKKGQIGKVTILKDEKDTKVSRLIRKSTRN